MLRNQAPIRTGILLDGLADAALPSRVVTNHLRPAVFL